MATEAEIFISKKYTFKEIFYIMIGIKKLTKLSLRN